MAENDNPQDQVFDFTDLAKETRFRFRDKEFQITSITFKMAKELFAKSSAVKVLPPARTLVVEGGVDSPDDPAPVQTTDMDFYSDFLKIAVRRGDGNVITTEDIEEWPMTMISRVVAMINEKISGPLDAKPASSTQPPAD
jgi:hypothetical protein